MVDEGTQRLRAGFTEGVLILEVVEVDHADGRPLGPPCLPQGFKRCRTPLLPPLYKRGRPRAHGWRAILEAIFSVVRSGCAWRLLPHDFPP
jgi:Putative transposase of IS4/5 family (DUF4096)